jgi:hypothetical protein
VLAHLARALPLAKGDEVKPWLAPFDGIVSMTVGVLAAC